MLNKRCKQVIVMRKDLQMTKGKMIAQGSHASLGVILQMMNVENTSVEGEYNINLNVKVNSPLDVWLNDGVKKVCVYVESEEDLINLYNMAKEKGLPAILIEDGGLTMFKGVPTKTCIAIGPAEEEEIDVITGDLKLL